MTLAQSRNQAKEEEEEEEFVSLRNHLNTQTN
jgi:hypothetical protein